MKNQNSLVHWMLAVLCAAGCSNAGDSEVAAPTGVATPVVAPVAVSDPASLSECAADSDCMRTDCCGAGDGCAPAPKGQACDDTPICSVFIWGACRCEASRCTGTFWDPRSDEPRPKEFAGW
jgi:hypothetical protein